MAIINFEEYIESLQKQVTKLKELLNNYQTQELDAVSDYKTKQSNLTSKVQSQISSSGFTPQSLGLQIPSSLSLDLSDEDFLRSLADIYKLY
jgi:lipid II:glycine glycyltransferase (peptidoglycan interpeptide bridge formation enzyme)